MGLQYVMYMSPSDSPDQPGSTLYHSKTSEVPLFSNQSWSGTFFAVSYIQQTSSSFKSSARAGHFLPFFFSFFNPSYKSFVTKLTKFLEWIKTFGHLSQIKNQYTLKNHLGPDQNILK